jgi:probable addiction module antidote protein
MAEKLKRWDAAEHLNSEEDIALFLEAAMEEGGEDPAFIAKALGTVARARGMTRLAAKTGLTRQALYKALSGEGHPEFNTIFKVAHALGYQFRLCAAPEAARASGTSAI